MKRAILMTPVMLLLAIAAATAQSPEHRTAPGSTQARPVIVNNQIRRAVAASTSHPGAAHTRYVESQVASKTRTPRDPNWVLVKATSTTVTRISSPFSVFGRRTGRGPLVVGIGMSVGGGPYPFNWVIVHRLSGGSPTLALTAGPAKKRIRFTVIEERGIFELSPVSIQDEARVVAVMVFVVNGVIDGVEWEPAGLGVRVRSSVRLGTGAAALKVSRPSKGVGFAAAGGGAGAGTYSRRVPAGIAGAIEWMSCQACVGTWTPPEGETHTWLNVRHQAWPVCWCGSVVGFGGQFAGPAGHWKWAWTGVSASDHGAVLSDDAGVLLAEPVVAAYAPIGSDWRLFTPCEPLLRCLV